jgi:hypothetical protein
VRQLAAAADRDLSLAGSWMFAVKALRAKQPRTRRMGSGLLGLPPPALLTAPRFARDLRAQLARTQEEARHVTQ